MPSARVERRLAAILAADVAGYSRLMEQDEAGTVARLKALRRELIEPVLGRFGGRFVDLKGDGAIVEFHSAVAAVEAAVEIQRTVASQEADRPEDERILYRIGINLGEVVVDGLDIYGDGVNIAARIEALCEPGGVWLAARVYDQVRGKIEVDFQPTGRHRVKNIAEPVEAWRAQLDGSVSSVRILHRPRSSQRQWWSRSALVACTVGLAILLAAGAGLYWWPDQEAAVGGKPGIAVLPFENMGGDETTARLANGITEDIITDLSHFRDLNVIARNSTFRYKGKAADMQEVGRELKVRYALEGSIQRQGDRIRVTAQLIDTETAAHVWSERWDRPAADVFAVQTEVAEKVAGTIGGDLTMGQITRAELQRAKRKRPSDLQAYDLFLLGEELKATYLHIPEGIDYLTRAIALDPHLARAYAIRAFLYYFMIWQGADPVEMTAKMVTDAEEAVRLDPRDASSLATLGYARGLERRWDDAVSLLDAAVELNPSNSHVLATVATGLAYVGQAERGSVYGDRAFLLDPRMTPANLNGIKDAYFMAKRYADTVMAATRMPEESRGRDAWAFLAIAQATDPVSKWSDYAA